MVLGCASSEVCVSWLLVSSEKVLFIGIGHKAHDCHSIVKVSLKVNLCALEEGGPCTVL